MDLDIEFRKWVSARDVEAFGRVFDATAGRLAVLAAHVAGRGQTAEDLVQATFLVALDRCDTWDPERPLWPWLASILVNEARMEQRRRRRRREVGEDGAHDAATAEAAPLDELVSSEAFDRTVESIRSMPQPYRRVLQLRLVNGLRAVEIARALEVPVGTVRSQVHRGLEMLRRSLPVGIAGVLAVWIDSEEGLLGRARTEVLAAATRHAAQSGVVSAPAPNRLTLGAGSGDRARRGLLAGSIAILLVTGIGWFVQRSLSRDGQSPAVVPPLTVESPPAVSASGGVAVSVPEREAVVELEGREPVWPLIVNVRGGSDGQNARLANAEVVAELVPNGLGAETSLESFVVRVAEGVTDARGVFRGSLDVLRSRPALERGTSLLRVRASHEGFASQVDHVALARDTAQRAYEFEMVLRATADVSGRVLLESGAPAGGVEIAWVMPAQSAGSRLEVGSTKAWTAPDGSFRLDREEDGGATLVAHDAALGFVAVEVPPPEASARSPEPYDVGDLTLRRGGVLEGSVVLGDGSGLGCIPVYLSRMDGAAHSDAEVARHALMQESRGTRLELADGALDRGRARVRTRPDGTFVCTGLDPAGTYAVGVRDSAFRFIARPARVADGGIRLVADRQLLTVDARGVAGEPLLGAMLLARGFDSVEIEPGTQPRLSARFFPFDDAGGRMLLTPFGWSWRLGHRDESAAPMQEYEHVAHPGVHRADVVLTLREQARFGAIRVRVVDERGAAWEEFGVRLDAPAGGASRLASLRVPSPVFEARDLAAGTWRVTVQLGRVAVWPEAIFYRGEHVEDVQVTDGEVAEVVVQTRPRGLIALRCIGGSAGARLDGLEVRAAGWPEPLSGRVCAGDRVYDAQSVRSRVAGESLFVVETAFLVGPLELEVRAPGGDVQRIVAAVAADRVTIVEVDLGPR